MVFNCLLSVRDLGAQTTLVAYKKTDVQVYSYAICCEHSQEHISDRQVVFRLVNCAHYSLSNCSVHGEKNTKRYNKSICQLSVSLTHKIDLEGLKKCTSLLAYKGGI